MSHSGGAHDKLVKEAFGDVEAARGMLRAVLPGEVLRQFDLQTLLHVPGSFVDEGLAAAHTDLLFSVQGSHGEALVYVLVEHKSQGDRWVLLQLLRYMVRIWERALREDAGADVLPVIIPLIVAHEPAGWTAPLDFHALFGATGPPGRIPSP